MEIYFKLPRRYYDEGKTKEIIDEILTYVSQFGGALFIRQDEDVALPVLRVYIPKEFMGVVKFGLQRIGAEVV